MSSSEDEPDTTQRKRSAKRPRRVARACDFCRRRKIRCDGGQGPGGKCGTCHSMNKDCSYVVDLGKDGGPKGYVEALEYKLSKMELLLKRLHPDEDFSPEVGIHITRDNWMVEGALGDTDANEASPFASGSARSASAAKRPTRTSRTMAQPDDPASILAVQPPSDDDEDLVVKLQELDKDFKSMHVGSFFGKAGGPYLVKTALQIKQQTQTTHHVNWAHVQRPTYWSLSPWEREAYEVKMRAYDFPEPDLLLHLVKLYFAHVNPILPILHRPTFENDIRKGLHFHQEAFGGLVLLVCATAARYSDDPRVLMESETDENTFLSAGWKWYTQVGTDRRSHRSASRLHDIQIYSLASQYLNGCARTSAAWSLVGIGIRLAQDIGAHKQKVYSRTPGIEDELFKRTFWALIWQDRLVSITLGRPCTLVEEDIDVDLPLEVDDEYLAERVQPSGKPSQIAYFVSAIKLVQIAGLILRTIYASSKAKTLYGFHGAEWAQKTVSNFDSVLNGWVDSLPDHLRWDPTREDEVFFGQSVHLHAYYYNLQILVHRPFLSERADSPIAFPSLAICLNAGRSVAHIAQAILERQPTPPLYYFFVFCAQAAGVTLLLGIWSVRRSGLAIDPAKEMENLHNVMKYFMVLETRHFTAGRLRDVMRTLMSLTGLPMPPEEIPRRNKRARESIYSSFGDKPASAMVERVLDQAQTMMQAQAQDRPIAGSSRVQAARTSPALSRSSHATSSHSSFVGAGLNSAPMELPMFSGDLGRMAPDDPLRILQHGLPANVGGGAPAAPFTFGQEGGVSFEDTFGPLGLGGFAMAPSVSASDETLFMLGFEHRGPGLNAGNTSDTWASVPTGYGDGDWDAFLKSINDSAQEHPSSQGTTPSSMGVEPTQQLL